MAQSNPISLSGGPVVKMVTDFQQPYIYAIEAPGPSVQNGTLLFINTASGVVDKTLTIGTNPTDMAINVPENKLYILDRNNKTVYRADLNTQTLLSPLTFNSPLSTISGFNLGRFLVGGQGNYYVCNTFTGLPVTTNYIAFDGDGIVDATGSFFFLGSVGGTPPIIARWEIQGDFLAAGAPAMVQQLQNVNAYGSYNLLLSHDNARLFYNGNVYNTNLDNLAWTRAEVFACSSNGTVAFTSTQVLDGTSWLPMYNLSVTSTVMAVAGDDQSFWYYNSTSNTVESLPMSLMQKPVILQQATHQTVMSGNTAVIGLVASGRTPLYYTWYLNGAKIASTTTNQISIPNFQAANAGNYSVTITNAYGTITSSNAAVAVSYVPPVFTNQPVSLVRPVGSNATFTAGTVGSLPMNYQWRFNGADIQNATNPVLNLANLQLANEGNYDLVASNAFGATNSTAAFLNVVDFSEALNTTNLTWVSAGDVPWQVVFYPTYDGFSALQSGVITSGQQSILQTSVTGPGTLTFWWKIDSEFSQDFNYLIFSDNSIEQSRITFITGWIPMTNYLGVGQHTLQWTFTQPVDSAVSPAGYVDEVNFTPGATAPFIAVSPTNQIVLLNSNATLTATVFGTPPLSYQWQLNGTNVAGATNTSLVLNNAQFSDEGNYTLTITNPFGTANTAPVFINVVDLAESLNGTNLVWTTTGNQPWFSETSTTHDGVAALQSGHISGNQQSTVQTTVNGPGAVTYWWKVSSETNNDYVNFLIDGAEQSRISGNIANWQQKTNYVPAGSHVLTWTYSKNATINSGSDAAWLDQVSFTPGTTGAYIAVNPVGQVAPLGGSAAFTVTAQGTPPLYYQWLFDNAPIPNATNATLTIPSVQMSSVGLYSVIVSNDFGNALSTNAPLYLQSVYAWGAGLTDTSVNPNYGQSAVPTNLNSVTAIAAGGYLSMALLNNGRVTAWGYRGFAQTNVPVTLTNAMAIAAGGTHDLALRSNGTVSAWGSATYGQSTVPIAATNISTVAAGGYHSLALRTNGTVIAWGAGTIVSSSPQFGQSIVPANLSNVTAIAAGTYHSVALRSDGSLVAWGLNASGQTNVPAGLTNVIAVAAGGSNTLALKRDGTLLAWGDNSFGQTNIPPDLTNVAAIAVGSGHMMALRNDGTLEAWGLNGNGQTNVPTLVSNVVSISAGANHSLAMVNAGPVTFLSPLQSLSVFRGSNATLTGAALGVAPLYYQWLKDGIAVTNATNSSLVFAPAQLTNSGNYQLVASNAFGAVTSSVAVLTVNDTMPFFVVQPAGQSVLQSSNVTLSVTVGGIPPFTYQWLFNGLNLPGATNSTLTISNVQPANEGNYAVLVTNALGSAQSSNAFLNLIDIAAAVDATNLTWLNVGQPGWYAETTNTHDGFAAAGIALVTGQTDSGGLQTAVTGPGVLSFWCQVPVGFTPLYFYVDSATVTSFSGPSTIWKSFTYYVAPGRHIIWWNLGNGSFGSQPAKAFLDQVSFVPGAVAPSFTSQPSSQTNAAGNSVSFSGGLVGTPPMTYQWYFNNAVLSGANNATLTLNDIQAANTGNYQLIVSNAAGYAVSSNASLTVTSSVPIITTQPVGISVMAGAQAAFAASAKGTEPLYYQWLTNGLPIAGATNASLTINNAQSVNSANYSLLVSNSVGTTLSSNAFLFVYTLSDLSSALDNSGIAWNATTNVPWFPETNVTHDGISAAQSGAITDTQQSTLQGTVTGPATVVYWWKVNCDSFWMSLAFSLNGTVQNAITGTVDWQSATNYIGAGSQVLQWNLYPIHNAFAGGTGWLDQVQVIPGGTPVTIVSNPSNTTNSAGNTVNFSVSAVGTPAFLYQWKFNSADIPGATNATLSLTNIQAGNAGTYSVAITNDFGFAISSDAALVVNSSLPVITTQPASQAAVVRSSVTLSVASRGTTPFTYQWYFNSNAIAGATNSSLVFTNLQLTNSGFYSVTVSNAIGSVASTNAWLDVNRTRVFDYWPVSGVTYTTPLGLGEMTAIAAGYAHSLVLRLDGTVLAWGSNAYGQTNVPAGLSNVVAIAAGETHSVALTASGTVAVWGDDRKLQTEVPAGLSNVVAISAGPAYTLALRNDGSVVGWGDDATGQIDIPSDVTNAVSIFAGYYNGFAFLADGTFREWGNGPVWQHNGINTQLNLQSSVTNATAIAASGFTAWSLQADGTVLPWGWFDGVGPGSIINTYSSPSGFYTFSSTGGAQRPWYPGVVAVVSSGNGAPPYDYALLLFNNGTVSEVGAQILSILSSVPSVPSNPGHAVAVTANNRHAMVLVNDGSPWIAAPTGVRGTSNGKNVTLSAGVVGGSTIGYQWQFNGTNINGGTNAQLVLPNIPLGAGGLYQCIVTNSLGAITNGVVLNVSRSIPTLGLGSFVPGSGLHINVNQLSGHGVTVIYSSTNMTDWKPVFTNSPTTGTIDWVDPSATNGMMRFYRAAEQ